MSLDHVNSSSRPGRILWSVVSRSMFDPSSVIWDGWLMTMAEAVQKAKDLAMRDSSAVQAGVLAGGLEFAPADRKSVV